MVNRRTVGIILSVAFALLALNAWAQVVEAAFGQSSDSTTLVALQFLIGLAGAATAWGGWRRATWTWRAALMYGVVTSSMLASLPMLLGLEADARPGIWAGAVAVLVFAWLCALFFRSDAMRRAGSPVEQAQ